MNNTPFNIPAKAYHHMFYNPNSPYKEQAENIISTDFYYSYFYARDIIKGRWTKNEKLISTSPQYSCLYAENVVKCRFPKAEKLISTHPDFSCYYANNIIKGRFPKAENIINKPNYLNYILKFNHE